MVKSIIDNAIEKLEIQLNSASRGAQSQEETAYASGLADALEILLDEKASALIIGREYYVLVWDEDLNTTMIQKRVLSKITTTLTKTAYCFSLVGKRDLRPVVLYSSGGLANRVFENYDDAVRWKEHVYLNQKVQY